MHAGLFLEDIRPYGFERAKWDAMDGYSILLDGSNRAVISFFF